VLAILLLILHVDIDTCEVALSHGATLAYDVLVVASGARLVPEETEGLTGPGHRDTVHSFYDLDGAIALERALSGFTGGRLVVNVVDMPIKWYHGDRRTLSMLRRTQMKLRAIPASWMRL
jgi:NADPH-dependent 2,4-dienoyl-CoA reductase/sulfur reductase-like enzyme